MRKKLNVAIRFLVAALIAPFAQAHSGKWTDAKDDALAASASFTYRTESTTRKGELGLIPGVVLGGEALPVKQGAVLDDAQLFGRWYGQDYAVYGVLTAHQHAEGSQVDLENFWLKYSTPSHLGGLELELGKMSSEATDLASFHASQSMQSEAPLLSDVFWGRHFTDSGIRLSKQFSLIRAGVEAWNGNSWPATEGEGSADVFIRMQTHFKSLDISISSWAMRASAEQRSDARYASGHSHSGQTISNPSADYQFTGTTDMAGVAGRISLPVGDGEIQTLVEWMAQVSDGDLQTLQQRSRFRSQYDGTRVELAFDSDQHNVTLSFEQVVIENRFYDNVTTVFIDEANLFNNGFEPTKVNLSWNFKWRPSVSFRSEIIANQTVSEETVYRVNFGFRWNQVWHF